MNVLSEEQIQVLSKNFENTNWSNPHYIDEVLHAEHYGKIIYPLGGGEYQPYNGTTLCKIEPSFKIVNEVFNYSFDQAGFISQHMDYVPV